MVKRVLHIVREEANAMDSECTTADYDQVKLPTASPYFPYLFLLLSHALRVTQLSRRA